MRKPTVKIVQIRNLQNNLDSLRKNTKTFLDAGIDRLMTIVDEELDLVLEKVNQTMTLLNGWMSKRQKALPLSNASKKGAVKSAPKVEVSRMDDEGGAGYLNTLPHADRTETSNVTAAEHLRSRKAV